MNIDASLLPKVEILHEESHFMLVNKPSGLFTQAAPGVPSLELELVAYLKQRDQHPGKPFIGLPHRLDRATSGMLLVARNKRALTRFGEQFQSRKVDKFYVAILEGVLPAGVHEWDDFMRKIQDQPRAEIVPADSEFAKLAQLRIESLATSMGRSLVLVQLLTGRMHQIRLQAAHRGWPISGDRYYGAATQIVASQEEGIPAVLTIEEEREQPHALHAYRLGFRHPQTAVPLSFSAPVPAGWLGFFDPELIGQIQELVARSQLLAASASLQ